MEQMTLNKNVLIALGVFLFAGWLFCFKMISPGHVGVIVDLFGEEKGPHLKELHVGMHWIAPWKKVYKFPIYEQNETWGDSRTYGFIFQTIEGMTCEANIGITFHLNPDKVPLLFAKYRRGMDEITNSFVKNYVRDAINMAASHLKIEDLYGEGKEPFFQSVETTVRDSLSPIGIDISRIYLIGQFEFPQNVLAALNSKIEATQRAQQRENELRETRAHAEKDIAQAMGDATAQTVMADAQAKIRMTLAKAEADANAMIIQSLTKELLTYHSIQKWNGQMPQIMGTDTVMPMVQLK